MTKTSSPISISCGQVIDKCSSCANALSMNCKPCHYIRDPFVSTMLGTYYGGVYSTAEVKRGSKIRTDM